MSRRPFASFISDYQYSGLQYALKQKQLDVGYAFRRLYRWIIKLIKYGRYLWDDYDYDDVYIFRILKLKLTLMADFFESNKAMSVGSEKRAKEMRRCIALLDRIINDKYADLPLDQLERKYGEMVWDFHQIPNSSFSTVDIHRNPPKGTPEYEAERKESSKIFKHAAWQKQNDINYLFDYMKRNIQKWWD
jgi:hypothetical protein